MKVRLLILLVAGALLAGCNAGSVDQSTQEKEQKKIEDANKALGQEPHSDQ
jgi:hypothetical protein